MITVLVKIAENIDNLIIDIKNETASAQIASQCQFCKGVSAQSDRILLGSPFF